MVKVHYRCSLVLAPLLLPASIAYSSKNNISTLSPKDNSAAICRQICTIDGSTKKSQISSLKKLRNYHKKEFQILDGISNTTFDFLIENLPKIRSIHFDNALSISRSISQIKNFKDLRHLTISDVQLERLDFIGELTKLQTLAIDPGFLTLNRINVLPDNFSKLKQLKHLTIKNLPLGSISKIKAKNLRSLHLHNIPIKSLASILSFKKLAKLTLSALPPQKLPDLGQLKNLRNLGVFKCMVGDTTFLENVHNLRELSISQTRIRDLSALVGMRYLHTLNAPEINLNSWEFLSKVNLEKLVIPYSNFTTPNNLKKMTNLKHLNIAATEVSDISPFSLLPHLNFLDLRESHANLSSLFKFKAIREVLVSPHEVSANLKRAIQEQAPHINLTIQYL